MKMLLVSLMLVAASASAFAQGAAVEDAALTQLRARAEAGNAAAQVDLGVRYAKGQGVAQDDAQAVQWFLKAADQGNAVAQFDLGVHYYNGRGVKKDYKEAMRWYRKAAEQGNVVAELTLGATIRMSDPIESIRWYRKSADDGYPKAQFALGQWYADWPWWNDASGHRVPRDYVEAYKWLSLAAQRATASDDQTKFVKDRDTVAKKLKPAELAEAQRRAQQWVQAFEARKK